MSESPGGEAEARLNAARESYESITADLETIGLEHVETLAEKLEAFDRILETYEDRATGTGDFGGYVAFRATVDQFVEGLPEDLPHREAFERAGERLDQRRLSEDDFEAARAAVADARTLVDRLDERANAATVYRQARRDAATEVDRLDERIRRLERLLAYAELDLKAPVSDLRDPIDAYNDIVTAAFETYLHETPATDVFSLLTLTDRFPLVPMPAPPSDLHRFVDANAPALTVPELLEYAGYSRSKLAHYVDDAAAFRAAVATEQTYLDRIRPDPFRVAWPPPPADRLRWRLRELVSVVNRFADESAIARLRAIQQTTREPDRYAKLRAVAEARTELSADERDRLESGAMARERRELEAARDRLVAALEDGPEPER